MKNLETKKEGKMQEIIKVLQVLYKTIISSLNERGSNISASFEKPLKYIFACSSDVSKYWTSHDWALSLLNKLRSLAKLSQGFKIFKNI